MSIEEPSAFSNKTIIKDGAVEIQKEERLNLKALENQRDKYILDAIKEFEKNNPEKFKQGDISYLAAEVIFLLEKRHRVNADAVISPPLEKYQTPQDKKDLDAAVEFIETYKQEHVEELLKNYLK